MKRHHQVGPVDEVNRIQEERTHDRPAQIGQTLIANFDVVPGRSEMTGASSATLEADIVSNFWVREGLVQYHQIVLQHAVGILC